MTVHSVVAELRALLAVLPGEIEKNVDVLQLGLTVGQALLKGGGPVGAIEAVVANAGEIFPNSSLYKRQAVEFLGAVSRLYSAGEQAVAALSKPAASAAP